MNSRQRKKIGFVVQRCGKEVNGGAEIHCLQFAQHFAATYETEVLTTCALDYLTWKDHYPPGVEQLGETSIRRFSVDPPRDIEKFGKYSHSIRARLGKGVTEKEEQQCLRMQGPCSRELEEYLIQHGNEYDWFYFFSYNYQPYFLLPHVREKAVLMPLAHEDWVLQMGIWDDFFLLPQKIIFNTIDERELLAKRFPHVIFDGPVVGCGIEPPEMVSPRQFRDKFNIREPFLLYLGRIDSEKGCSELFDYFITLRKTERKQRKLVLMGKTVMDIPQHPDIISLGFVSEQDKWNGLAAADWLLNFSPFESLSLVLLEAWSVGTPTIVTDKCDVLINQSKRGNGSLWCKDFATFRHILHTVSPLLISQFGRQDKRFVEENYTWEKIVARVSGVLR